MHRPHLLVLAALLPAPLALAQNGGVRLNTLPERERVEIRLDSPFVTLVEEERFVPLAKGLNDVHFAWQNTRIDAASIQFRCLEGPEGVQVVSVSYPPGQQALTWQVAARTAGAARVRISYLIGGLERENAYRAVADRDETALDLRQFVLLHNRAGETFGESGMTIGGEHLVRPIDVNETKQLLVSRVRSVPVQKTYTADLARYGWLDQPQQKLRIPMHYVVRNDEKSGLGREPLPYGKARIFQDDGRGTDAFLGEDWAPLTPRDDRMRLQIGVAKDVEVKRFIDRRERIKGVGSLYDLDIVVRYEIENFKDEAVELTIAESLENLRAEVLGHTGRPVEWTLEADSTLGAIDAEESDADRPVFRVALPAAGDDQKAKKIVHRLHVRIRNEW